MRELVILGTASQAPTRERNHNGYLLRWDGQGYQEGLLFDPGEGTQRQMLLAGVSSSTITRICVTHVHGDHCFGLPGVLSRMVLDGVEHPVHLHYPESGGDVVRALVSLASPGLDLRLMPHAAAGEVADGLEVVPLVHRVQTFGFRVREPDGWTVDPARAESRGVRGPEIGRLLRSGSAGGVGVADVASPRPGQKFAIVMDTAPCDGADDLAEGADLLLVESTFADDDVDLARQYRHLTASQAGALGRDAGARRTVLTHFSARYRDLTPLLREAEASARERAHPGRDAPEVLLARDLDRVAFPSRHRLETGGQAGA